MKVVIAGGSGLIGGLLTASFLRAGHEVVHLGRPGRVHAEGPDVARHVDWEPPGLGRWTHELDGADVVVNLAGASVGRWPWTPARRRHLVTSRLGPTRALVDVIATLPPGRRPRVLLSASGTDVYAGRGDAQSTEASPVGTSFLARLCVAWEREAALAGELGVRVVLMRMSPVVAPGATWLRVASLPVRWLGAGPIGGGRHWVSWVAAEDVAGLFEWAIGSPSLAGVLNVSAPDPRPQRAYARAIGAALGRPAIVPIPGWLVRLALGPQATLALGSRRVCPEGALAGGYRFRVPRLEDALEAAFVPGAGGTLARWTRP